MKGHVRKRGARWAFVVEVDRGADGKRRQKWRSGFKTRKAAQSAMTAALATLNRGGDPFPTEIKTADYLARWLGEKKHTVRAGTWRRYDQLVRDYVLPIIGEMPLHTVKAEDIRRVLAGMRERPLAAATIAQARAALGNAFQCALNDERITTNPVRAVPRPKVTKPDLVVPTAADMMALMRAAEGTIWAVPVTLAVATGARRSEVLAVRWEHVDFDTGRVKLFGAVHAVGGVLTIGEQKSAQARRTVTLPAFAIDVLRRHRVEQAARRLHLGSGWQSLDLVCDRGDGGFLHPDSFTSSFKRLAGAAGLPAGLRLHDVRHGVATALLGHGVHMGVASAMLGHSSPAFTMAVYQHVTGEMTDQAAEAIEAAFASGT